MGISIWQLLIVLVIVLLLFGTKKLRNLGSDLGGAIKSFRSAVRDGEEAGKTSEPEQLEQNSSGTVIDGEITEKAAEQKRDSA